MSPDNWADWKHGDHIMVTIEFKNTNESKSECLKRIDETRFECDCGF